MSKQRNIRKRRILEEEDEVEGIDEPQVTAEDVKLLQKERQRRPGIGADELAGKERKAPRLARVGDLNSLEDDVLGTAFNREHDRGAVQDHERELFVEREVARRMGRALPDEEASLGAMKQPKTLEDIALQAVAPKQRAEDPEDPGAAFVAGVAEVPLSVEQKLRNIEATEAAKAALLGKGAVSAFDVEDQEEFGVVGGGKLTAAQRRQFPTRFGKPNPKAEAARADAAVRKGKQRAKVEEMRRLQMGDW